MGVGAILLFPLLWTSPRRVDHRDPEKAVNRNDTIEGDPGDQEDIDDDDNDEVDHDRGDIDVNYPLEPDNVDEVPTRPALSQAPSQPPTTKPSLLLRLKSVLFPTSDEDDEDEWFIPNYRILPIISGIIIPFSILLEIPGLTDKWYIRTESNKIVDTKQNTILLDVGMSISMLCAVIANVCVVLRFLEKGGVKIMTILAVIALTVHDTINIVTIVVFGVEHRFNDGFTYGASYWSTVCSTIASTATNITLIWDFFATPNFAKSGSGLTRKQRSLSIIVIILLCYIAFGALVNSFLINLKFINALYFTVVSIETVGFGDIAPIDTSSRVFICFYVAFGIVNLGVAVGMCRETVFEQLEVSYRRRIASVRQKRASHRRWKALERAWKHSVEWRLKQMRVPEWVRDDEPEDSSRMNAAECTSRNKSPLVLVSRILSKFEPLRLSSSFKSHGQVRGIDYGHPDTHLNIEALSAAQFEAAAIEAGIPLDTFHDFQHQHHRLRLHGTAEGQAVASPSGMLQSFMRPHPIPQEHQPACLIHEEIHKMSDMLTKFALASTGIGIDPQRTPQVQLHGDSGSIQSQEVQRPVVTSTQSSRLRGELLSGLKSAPVPYSLKQSIESEETKAFWAKLVVAWSLFIVFWQAGAGIFSATEGWSYGTSMYFCFMTFTTTGYGDYAPETPAGRSIFVVWALLGLGTMTILVSVLQDAFSSRYKSALHGGAFQKAVKRYRQRDKQRSPYPTPPSPAPQTSTTNVGVSAIRASNELAQRQLEALPVQILRHSRKFYKHVQYFVHHSSGSTGYREGGEITVPIDLKLILDEIARAQHLGDRVKTEILQDEEARNALLMLSFEKVLREMIDIAERSLSALAERDRLKARYQHQHGEGSRAETPLQPSEEQYPIPPNMD